MGKCVRIVLIYIIIQPLLGTQMLIRWKVDRLVPLALSFPHHYYIIVTGKAENLTFEYFYFLQTNTIPAVLVPWAPAHITWAWKKEIRNETSAGE